jgi:hypothetical protein
MNLNNEQRKVRSGPGGSTFRVEKKQTAHSKGIVPLSGNKSVPVNGYDGYILKSEVEIGKLNSALRGLEG